MDLRQEEVCLAPRSAPYTDKTVALMPFPLWTKKGELFICGTGSNETIGCLGYDASTGNTELNFTLDLDPPMAYSTPIALDDGRIWISGGSDNGIRIRGSLFIHPDLTTTPGPDLPSARFTHCVVQVNQSHVLIHGGSVSPTSASNEAFLLPLSGQVWTRLPTSKDFYAGHQCACVDENQVFVVKMTPEGGSMESLLLETLTWTSRELLPFLTMPQVLTLPLPNSFALLGVGQDTSDLAHVYRWNKDRKEFEPMYLNLSNLNSTPSSYKYSTIIPVKKRFKKQLIDSLECRIDTSKG